MSSAKQSGAPPHAAPREIAMPASNAWPITLAFGATLVFAGLLTSVSVTVLGAILFLFAAVGWFREVFPHEHEELVPIIPDDFVPTTSRQLVERVPLAEEQVRAWLPVETYPISAGVKGGLAGGVAMAILACTYGIVSAHSIWYPINLLSAVVYSSQEARALTPAWLDAFHPAMFFFACLLHLTGCILVGLLYGAMLPMFSRHPIVLGGLIGPVMWSGLLYSTIDLLNPVLGTHIRWGWFMASQVAFGVVAGLVVVRQTRVRTHENMPFALRAGIEAPGMMLPKSGGEKR
jgi:hypothetical protein